MSGIMKGRVTVAGQQKSRAAQSDGRKPPANHLALPLSGLSGLKGSIRKDLLKSQPQHMVFTPI